VRPLPSAGQAPTIRISTWKHRHDHHHHHHHQQPFPQRPLSPERHPTYANKSNPDTNADANHHANTKIMVAFS
jgi:hypothetical protein